MSWYARAPMMPEITPQRDIRKTRSQSPPQRTQRTPVSQMQPAMPISSITPYMWIVKCDQSWNEPDDGAAAAPAAAGTSLALSPNVITMKTTSAPSRKTPLNETTNAIQSSPNRRSSRARFAASACSRKASSSSCSAFSPAERRIALRSHCSPKTSRSVPMPSWSAERGSHVASA